jgi:hypothetical protein
MCPWFDSWRNHKKPPVKRWFSFQICFLDLQSLIIVISFAPLQKKVFNGFLAQLVEQWIENPCVPGSIPGETT